MTLKLYGCSVLMRMTAVTAGNIVSEQEVARFHSWLLIRD